MPPRTLTTLLVLTLAGGAAGCGSSTVPPPVAPSLPPVAQAVAVARGSVPISLLASEPATVRIEGQVDGRVLGPPITVRVPRGRRVPATLRLDADGARELSSCEDKQVVVEVHALDGDGGRRASAPIRHQAPVCGRYFASEGTWNRALQPGAPLDPNSVRLTAELLAQVRSNYAAKFGPTVNTTQYSTSVYTVGRDQPRVPVTLDRSENFAQELRRTFAAGVPIPPDARPARGTDGHLVVWQPDTDTMWEFFVLQRRTGRWHAAWGGRMDHVSRNPGVFGPRNGILWGATATSLPLLGGLVTLDDLRRGRIDHALALAIPQTRSRWWSLPALRTDGHVGSLAAIPEGARFRLDPTLDLASLDLPPIVRMLAEAAQRYGMIVRDKAGVVALYGEAPRPGSTDPYPALFGGKSPSEVLKAFPWDRLQLLRLRLTTYNPIPPGPSQLSPTANQARLPRNCEITLTPCP